MGAWAVIGAVLGGLGVASSYSGQKKAAKQQKAAAEEQARQNRLVSGIIMEKAAMGLDVAADQAGLMRAEGDLLYADGEFNAYRIATNAVKFFSNQKASYIKSGVEITGSPMLILDETARFAAEDVQFTLEKAENAKRLMYRKAELSEKYAEAEYMIAQNEAAAVREGANLQASAAQNTYSAQMWGATAGALVGAASVATNYYNATKVS